MEVLNKFNTHQKNLPMKSRNKKQIINMPIGEMYLQQELNLWISRQ